MEPPASPALEAKIEAGVFVGLQFRQIFAYEKFPTLLNRTQKASWNSFKAVVSGFLKNNKAAMYDKSSQGSTRVGRHTRAWWHQPPTLLVARNVGRCTRSITEAKRHEPLPPANRCCSMNSQPFFLSFAVQLSQGNAEFPKVSLQRQRNFRLARVASLVPGAIMWSRGPLP
ncbi:hypothetical protein EVAR_89185_1 [Eumeta japonica]|uniref:Uncharacterized protein n=1 Tax=Eumeta variegata TaxID=151549 RepID=A0A4C1YGR0_EUMVA|nr:hypothetical protein EVAR_89185_1 [Eumeta japonica]